MYNSDLPNRAELPSSKQLLRSTIIAIIVATVLLVTVVLPSEYGIDPTRIGRVLGLTEMGEIKTQLAAEAERDRAVDALQPASETADASTAPVRVAKAAGAPKTDELTVTLKPGEGAEIKLAMSKGAKARYEWRSAGGRVNHDTHGDGPGGASHSFSKGREVERDSGELTAPFDGNHGWFWRNRSDSEVTVTLKVTGEYSGVKRVA
ncbi:MAG: transmembrane anchor protein [Acidobacteriota bacterium]|nr:transmembrane anchor protein [Acidobacteriota bacterium]